MEEIKKPKISNKKIIFIIISFIVICIIAFVFVMVKMIKTNSECAENPFVYSANLIVDDEGEPVYSLCSCNVGESKFYFDMDGIYEDNPLISNGIVN